MTIKYYSVRVPMASAAFEDDEYLRSASPDEQEIHAALVEEAFDVVQRTQSMFDERDRTREDADLPGPWSSFFCSVAHESNPTIF